jgi:hypothetical protein
LWQRIYRIFVVCPLETGRRGAHIRTMQQTQYTVKETPIGTFEVEVREPKRPVSTTPGFRTRETAEKWIREQKQMAAAVDRWDGTKIGQMHRDD